MEHHILQGDLSLSEILTTIGLENIEDLGQELDWLIDLRQAKLLASPAEIRDLGTKIKAKREKSLTKGECRMVALAEDDVTFGLLRIFIVYAESENARLHVCRSEPEARSFLTSKCA